MPEFRERVLKAIANNGSSLATQQLYAAALEEVIWAVAVNFVDGKEPSACQKMMGQKFVTLLEDDDIVTTST